MPDEPVTASVQFPVFEIDPPQVLNEIRITGEDISFDGTSGQIIDAVGTEYELYPFDGTLCGADEIDCIHRVHVLYANELTGQVGFAIVYLNKKNTSSAIVAYSIAIPN